jgi:hypothetical protein
LLIFEKGGIENVVLANVVQKVKVVNGKSVAEASAYEQQ